MSLSQKNFLATTFYSLLHQMPSFKFFSVVSVNSILSLKQMKIASISNSFEQLCLEYQFALLSPLASV